MSISLTSVLYNVTMVILAVLFALVVTKSISKWLKLEVKEEEQEKDLE
jgi:hypothetical protein